MGKSKWRVERLLSRERANQTHSEKNKSWSEQELKAFASVLTSNENRYPPCMGQITLENHGTEEKFK